MRKGDILLIPGNGTLLSKIISWFTKSEWVHCAMYIGNKEIIEAGWKGVKILPCNTYGGENTVLRHQHANVYNKRLNEAVAWSKTQVGKKYDYLGLLGIAMALINKGRINPLDNKNRYWCSELVADAYLNAKLTLGEGISKKTYKVSPADLANNEWFYEVKSKCDRNRDYLSLYILLQKMINEGGIKKVVALTTLWSGIALLSYVILIFLMITVTIIAGVSG